MFLYRVEAAISVMQVETSVKKYLDKFFKEYNLPVPRIKIVNRMTAGWLGRDVYAPRIDKANTTLEIQKSITNDEKTLDRVICHELIHHWDFLSKFAHPEQGKENWDKHVTHKRLGFKSDGHGKEFQEWAAKINAVMGKDYVTEKSDTSYVVEITKDYFLLIMPINKSAQGQHGWAWALKPSTDQKAIIQQKIREDGGRLFMSRDERWLSGAKIKKYGGMSVPTKEDGKKALKELYDSGKDIKPNWPSPISKVSDFHKKMVNHYGTEMKDILDKDPLGVLRQG